MGVDPFDVGMQRQLASLAIEDRSIRGLLKTLTAEGHYTFVDPASAWVWRHLDSESATTRNQLRNESNRLNPTDPVQSGVSAVLGAVFYADAEYIRRTLVQHAKFQVFRRGYSESSDLWNRGDQQGAMDRFMMRIDQIQSIHLDDSDRLMFFEGLSERMDRRASEVRGYVDRFPVGIDAIDDAMNGGIKRGHSATYVAYSGIGKTFALCEFAWSVARMRHKVLYVNLEGSTDYVASRLDARFMQQATHLVEKGVVDRDKLEWAMREYQILKGNLIIRGRSDSGSFTTDRLWAEVNELKVRYNWIPDAVVIDYGDAFDDPGEDERIRQIRIFKRIHDFGTYRVDPAHPGHALVTATQAVRPTPAADEKEHVLWTRDVSEAWGKVWMFEHMFSINRTVREKDAEFARVAFIKNRHGLDGIVVKIRTNYPYGEFIKPDETQVRLNISAPTPAEDPEEEAA